MRSIWVAVVLLAVGSGVWAAPRPGFVTVIGSAVPGYSHADRGAPVPLQALAIKHSGAEVGYCNVVQNGAIDPLIETGKPVSAYVYTSQSETTFYYGKGVRLFIFGNEPDGAPGTYGSILQQAYPLFQSVAPGSTVIGGNCYSIPPYTTLYQSYSFKNNCNMVGFHCYSDDPATGISIPAVVSLHNVMNTWSDGSKKMFLGEGWGPKRELRATPRMSPLITPTLSEIQAMRDFVVNGWANLSTSHDGYDPNWVDTVLFFTLSDNWGFSYAHFYNGGLIDLYGNPKDDLLLLFPGNKLTVANCGFEYYSLGQPGGSAPFWLIRGGTSSSCYAIDGSIRRAGLRSQRVELAGTTEAYISQNTAAGSVTSGQAYTLAAWVKTQSAAGTGARIRIRFLDSGGTSLGEAWSSALTGTGDWTRLQVTATAPSSAVKMRIDCNLQGTAGKAWFDDCSVSASSALQTGSIEGYVLKTDNNPISGASVTLQPGGASVVSDSTGKFTIANLDGGAYDVSASAAGYSSRTVTRVVVAPGRTSVAGLQLSTLPSGAPANVTVTSPGVSTVLKIAWTAPSGGADFYRVYRSTASGSLGSRIRDNVAATTIHDEGLTDFTNYYYTVRAVKSGSETTNADQYAGVPTGGATMPVYDTNADPDWANNATVHGQTFTPSKSGSIVSATCVLANSASPNNRSVTFTVHSGGPGGAQIGPSKVVTCYFNEIGTAQWASNEVPVVAGQTYYLRLALNSAASMYRTKADVVAGGRYYMNDVAYSANVDMWSTITLAESSAPDILNVAATHLGGDRVRITWETTAPATSQADYGPTTAYASSTPLDSSMTALHEATIENLAPGTYHFRVRSTRTGLPEAVSLDYVFTVPPFPQTSLLGAKQMPDGSFVRIAGLVVCADQSDFASRIAVETPDRMCGIAVFPSYPVSVTRGQTVEVQGKMNTVDGERRIVNAVVS